MVPLPWMGVDIFLFRPIKGLISLFLKLNLYICLLYLISTFCVNIDY